MAVSLTLGSAGYLPLSTKAEVISFSVQGGSVVVKPVRDAAGTLHKYAGNNKSGADFKKLKAKFVAVPIVAMAVPPNLAVTFALPSVVGADNVAW